MRRLIVSTFASIDGIMQGNVDDVFPIDFHDAVPGFDARSHGRGVVDGGNDREKPLFDRNDNPDAAELTLRFDLHFLEILRFHEPGVRVVQLFQHAFDGAVDQVLVVDILFDVVGFDEFHDLADKVKGFEVGNVRRGGGSQPGGQEDDEPDDEEGGFRSPF